MRIPYSQLIKILYTSDWLKESKFFKQIECKVAMRAVKTIRSL